MSVDYTPAFQELRKATEPIWSPPPRITVSQWATQFRMLSKEYSVKDERYRLDRVPWAKEPQDACHEKDVRTVVLLWSRQMTKTTVVENVIGYHIDQEPTPMLMVQPTVEAAIAYSKERLTPTLRDTPALREKVSDSPTRDSSNTIQVKMFPGGSLALMGANSPTGLGMRSRGKVFFDEVDRYPPSAGSEGDPIAIGSKTTETFPDSVIYITSTPTVKGYSRIELEFEETDKRKWFVRCPHCQKEQILEWAYVRFPGNIEDAHIVCREEECGRPWTESQRAKAVRNGRWKATAPFNGKRGYFINGIYSLFAPKKGYKSRLHQAVDEFIIANRAKKRGNVELLKTWINCYLAETWEEEAKKLDPTAISKRAEEYTPESLPVGALVVMGGADVQKDRIEVEWQAIGLEEESWGIEVEKVYGDTEKPAVWKQLSQRIERRFKRADGVELTVAALGIDTHYRPKEARRWCKAHGTRVNVYPVLGSAVEQATLVLGRYNKFSNQRIWSIATAYAKDTIYARLEIEEQGPRYPHMPRGYGYTDEWYAQLTCEKVATRYVNGFPKRVYVKDDNASNEAIDMRVYALAVFEILRPNLEVIDKLLKEAAEKIKTGGTGTPPPKAPPAMKIGGNFIGGQGFVIGGSASWVNG